MPIEIKELIIRARVEPGPGEKEAAAAGPTASGTQRNASPAEDIVRECVAQVMEMLRRDRER